MLIVSFCLLVFFLCLRSLCEVLPCLLLWCHTRVHMVVTYYVLLAVFPPCIPCCFLFLCATRIGMLDIGRVMTAFDKSVTQYCDYADAATIGESLLFLLAV